MARPRGTGKPPGTHYLTKTFTCPPELSAEVEEYIPPRERSAILQKALTAAVTERKRLGVRSRAEMDALAEEGIRAIAETPDPGWDDEEQAPASAPAA